MVAFFITVSCHMFSSGHFSFSILCELFHLINMTLCFFRCALWWLPVWQQWHFLQPQLSIPVPKPCRLHVVPQTKRSNCSAGAPVCRVSPPRMINTDAFWFTSGLDDWKINESCDECEKMRPPVFSNCYCYIVCGFIFKPLFFFCSHHRIEDHPTCNYDAIYVYDGSSTHSRLLGKVCGRKNTTFHSTGYYLTVRFRSNSFNTLGGFRADYKVVGKSQWLWPKCFCTFYAIGSVTILMISRILVTIKTKSVERIVLSVLSVAGGSCRYTCDYQVGNCSCSSSCRYRGNCCPDYEGKTSL